MGYYLFKVEKKKRKKKSLSLLYKINFWVWPSLSSGEIEWFIWDRLDGRWVMDYGDKTLSLQHGFCGSQCRSNWVHWRIPLCIQLWSKINYEQIFVTNLILWATPRKVTFINKVCGSMRVVETYIIIYIIVICFFFFLFIYI